MDKHTVIGLGKKMGESHAHCSCGWSISGSAGAVATALVNHLPVTTRSNEDRVQAWARRAFLPFTGRTS